MFKRYRMLGSVLCLVAFNQVAFAQATTDGANHDRKKIGLVLSGGGAKGAAHIGVIEVLEANRIPVDIVTGTSMGAYVGGMYAMGLDATEVKNRTFSADWEGGYKERVGRNDLVLRRKQQNDDYQLHTDLGISLAGEFKSKPGAFQGQGMAVLLRSLTHNLPTLKSFDDLAIPYRSVATDIAKVQPVVLDSGHLATTMQASMTVPGALKPVIWHNKQLVDGGVVNNMPVDVAKSLGADVIIAVDLRDPLLPESDLNSALNIISQLTTFMTNSNTDHQISLMQEGDVYLQPSVAFMTAPDFDKMELAYVAGKNIARASLSQLLPYQLSEEDYTAYIKAKQDRRSRLSSRPAYYIDNIVLDNHTLLSDQALLALLDLPVDRVISTEELEKAVERLHAQDNFSRITYFIDQKDDKNILNLDVTEKSWGPGYLNFKFSFEDDFTNRSDFSFGAQYIYTDLTDRGGEWKLEWEIGSWKKVNTEFYFPIDDKQEYFTAFGLGWNNEIRKFTAGNDSFATLEPGLFNFETQYEDVNTFAEIGWNIRPWSALKVGYQGQRGDVTLIDNDGTKEKYSAYGPYIAATHDTLDSYYFPSAGLLVDARFGHSQTSSQVGSNETDDKTFYYDINLMKPFSYDRHTVSALVKTGGSDSNELLPIYVQDLGGLFNLSGYHRYELNGRYRAFGALIYRYRWIDNDFGIFSTPIYLGGSLEQGGVWNDKSDISWNSAITAGSLYIGIDSPIGPVYLGYGLADGKESSVYFSLGGSFK